MGRLSIPIREHNKIRTSPGVVAAVRKIADEIADEATQRYNAGDGGEDIGKGYYATDMTVGTDRVRAHVWPTDTAVHEEREHAYLMQIVAAQGPR